MRTGKHLILGTSLFLGAILILSACQHNQSAMLEPTSKAKQIAMIIPFQGYDTSELWESKKMFEAEGLEVTVVSWQKGEAVSGAGVPVQVDLVINRVKVKRFDAFMFVGSYDGKPSKAYTLARKAVDQGKVLAAISNGSNTLAHAGVLKGKRATGHRKAPIVEHGGIYADEYVVVDGNLITAVGPNVVKEFAQAIISALKR